MPVTNSHGEKDLRKADASNRTWRTVLQGAVVVAIGAVLTALLDALNKGEFDLKTIGISAATAAGMAILAYLHRTFVDPSGIPSALPPSDPGEPADADPAP